MNKEQIIEAIESMTVLELSELVKALEEKFGVSAAALAAAPAAGGDAGAAARTRPGSLARLAVAGRCGGPGNNGEIHHGGLCCLGGAVSAGRATAPPRIPASGSVAGGSHGQPDRATQYGVESAARLPHPAPHGRHHPPGGQRQERQPRRIPARPDRLARPRLRPGVFGRIGTRTAQMA